MKTSKLDARMFQLLLNPVEKPVFVLVPVWTQPDNMSQLLVQTHSDYSRSFHLHVIDTIHGDHWRLVH